MGFPVEADWADLRQMPEYDKLMTEFKRANYADCSLTKYMDKHKVRADSRDSHLLHRLLTMDPTRRVCAAEAMQDAFFREDPRPTTDVFNGCPIPYPKREFLADDDDDKAKAQVDQAKKARYAANPDEYSTGSMQTGSQDYARGLAHSASAHRLQQLNAQQQMRMQPGNTLNALLAGGQQQYGEMSLEQQHYLQQQNMQQQNMQQQNMFQYQQHNPSQHNPNQHRYQ